VSGGRVVLVIVVLVELVELVVGAPLGPLIGVAVPDPVVVPALVVAPQPATRAARAASSRNPFRLIGPA
jgi:hypothetical protein